MQNANDKDFSIQTLWDEKSIDRDVFKLFWMFVVASGRQKSTPKNYYVISIYILYVND